MNVPGKSFFRAGALERFIQGRARLILPAFVSPRGFVLLWLVLSLVLAAGALAWSAQVPRFEAGVAVVVEAAQARVEDAGEAPLLLAFLPPATLPRLKAGEPLFLQGRPGVVADSSTILSVGPQVLSPAAAKARFGLELPPQALSGPSAVVVARFQPGAAVGKATDYLGTVYPVNVRVGTRRLLWLLPFLDKLHPE
ncbi:MAG: hypothetical protein ACJ8AT_29955 [Hyalangium sp.]|uniref:hypothetical protein n=1 Tax=Hyalangium sp. TaxID=2028555 RepID=UPI003899D203